MSRDVFHLPFVQHEARRTIDELMGDADDMRYVPSDFQMLMRKLFPDDSKAGELLKRLTTEDNFRFVFDASSVFVQLHSHVLLAGLETPPLLRRAVYGAKTAVIC